MRKEDIGIRRIFHCFSDGFLDWYFLVVMIVSFHFWLRRLSTGQLEYFGVSTSEVVSNNNWYRLLIFVFFESNLVQLGLDLILYFTIRQKAYHLRQLQSLIGSIFLFVIFMVWFIAVPFCMYFYPQRNPNYIYLPTTLLSHAHTDPISGATFLLLMVLLVHFNSIQMNYLEFLVGGIICAHVWNRPRFFFGLISVVVFGLVLPYLQAKLRRNSYVPPVQNKTAKFFTLLVLMVIARHLSLVNPDQSDSYYYNSGEITPISPSNTMKIAIGLSSSPRENDPTYLIETISSIYPYLSTDSRLSFQTSIVIHSTYGKPHIIGNISSQLWSHATDISFESGTRTENWPTDYKIRHHSKSSKKQT
jgi:hypothetical protein